jgi:hypothetical protein
VTDRRASLFDRRTAGVGDEVALDPNLSAAHPHGPASRRGEPLADQAGQHVDGEAIGEQSPFGVAVGGTAGEEIQRLALFRAEVSLRGWHKFKVGLGMPVREVSRCLAPGRAFIRWPCPA